MPPTSSAEPREWTRLFIRRFSLAEARVGEGEQRPRAENNFLLATEPFTI
jgi:hypothetical protein